MPNQDRTAPIFTKPQAAKDLQSLTIWDMESIQTGLSLRQTVWAVFAAWLAGGVGGLIYWWKRSVQRHGAITQRDTDQWPLLVGVFVVCGLIFVYLFFRTVFPMARRDLAKLQEEAKAEDTHSSTTSPSC